jgi:CRISPR/Cas system-associated exonuclease Cas4 (RecB family)
MSHHTFSPSKLDQLRICPGSYKMQVGIPEQPASEYAEEGRMLHECVATGSTEGISETQEELVQSCWDFLNGIRQEDDEVIHEQKIEISSENGEVLTFGTADVIIKHKSGEVSVIDWKFGYTPVKHPAENAQLATYSAAAMEFSGASECTGYIYQPRLRYTAKFRFTNRPAIVKNIEHIIRQATGEKLILCANDESCRYCKARLGCPAFREKYQRIMAIENSDLESEETLVRLYEDTKVLKPFIAQIEDAVKQMIESVGKCGNYIFKESYGSRKIPDINSLYDRLKDLLTPREFNEICSVSIGKLEALATSKIVAASENMPKAEAKRLFADMVADLIVRGTPSKTIVEG